MKIFCHAKYEHWIPFNETLPSESPYEVVDVDNKLSFSFIVTEEDTALIKNNPTERHQYHLPILTVNVPNEYQNSHHRIQYALSNNANFNTWSIFKKGWNREDLFVRNKIFLMD